MTNHIAIPLGLVILAAVATDVIFLESQTLVFLGKKMFNLMEWMAFWR